VSDLPDGDGWIHEVKFDGYRCQLHKAGDDVVIFSKNGRDFTNRLPGIRDAVPTLPCKSAVIDGEVVACKADGTPDFRALHSGNYTQETLCASAFDLMELNGERHAPSSEGRRPHDPTPGALRPWLSPGSSEKLCPA
jgi:bifunctional non-homologous end joining protein LigD